MKPAKNGAENEKKNAIRAARKNEDNRRKNRPSGASSFRSARRNFRSRFKVYKPRFSLYTSRRVFRTSCLDVNMISRRMRIYIRKNRCLRRLRQCFRASSVCPAFRRVHHDRLQPLSGECPTPLKTQQAFAPHTLPPDRQSRASRKCISGKRCGSVIPLLTGQLSSPLHVFIQKLPCLPQ